MLDVRNRMVPRREHLIVVVFCVLSLSVPGLGSQRFTPCIVSVFPLARCLTRDLSLHGDEPFIAQPGPVPLQGPPLIRFCSVAGSYTGTACPRGSLHARVAPYCCSARCCLRPRGLVSHSPLAWTHAYCAQVKTISSHPNFPVLGAMCQMQSIHSSPRRTPATEAVVPGGWIDLTEFCYA